MESYTLWTSELLKISHIIQQKRANMVLHIQNELNNLSQNLNKPTDISIEYKPSKLAAHGDATTMLSTKDLPASRNLDEGWVESIDLGDLTADIISQKYLDLFNKEYFYKRTLFGAHLDDLDISFNNKAARIYSSRGQQKLIIFLLKFALIRHAHNHSLEFILLIDDFFSDFDNDRSQDLLLVASKLASQIFITAPSESTILNNLNFKSQIINLDI